MYPLNNAILSLNWHDDQTVSSHFMVCITSRYELCSAGANTGGGAVNVCTYDARAQTRKCNTLNIHLPNTHICFLILSLRGLGYMLPRSRLSMTYGFDLGKSPPRRSYNLSTLISFATQYLSSSSCSRLLDSLLVLYHSCATELVTCPTMKEPDKLSVRGIFRHGLGSQ